MPNEHDGTEEPGEIAEVAETDGRGTERVPNASRPETESTYGIPDSTDGTLPWSFVEDRMGDEQNYWVSTTRPDGRPHARPVWGVWVDGTFHCGGGPQTRWVRNLDRNPAITVHREDAEVVVVVEGVAEKLTEETADADRLDRIEAAYVEKYDIEHGTPVFAVHPETVLAWSEFPTDATRWTFEE